MSASLWKTLRVGDSIRITALPSEVWASHGETKALLERLIRERAAVSVTQIDEDGYPWIEYTWHSDDGTTYYESLMIHHDGIELVL